MKQSDFIRQVRQRALAVGDDDGFRQRVASRTPDQRARVQAAYEKFCREHAEAKQVGNTAAAHEGRKVL